jgi:hypothetical protein
LRPDGQGRATRPCDKAVRHAEFSRTGKRRKQDRLYVRAYRDIPAT